MLELHVPKEQPQLSMNVQQEAVCCLEFGTVRREPCPTPLSCSLCSVLNFKGQQHHITSFFTTITLRIHVGGQVQESDVLGSHERNLLEWVNGQELQQMRKSFCLMAVFVGFLQTAKPHFWVRIA